MQLEVASFRNKEILESNPVGGRVESRDKQGIFSTTHHSPPTSCHPGSHKQRCQQDDWLGLPAGVEMHVAILLLERRLHD